MKRIYFSVVLCSFFLGSVMAQNGDVKVFEKSENAYGLINSINNKVVLSPKYLTINQLSDDLFSVKNKKGLVGVVSKKGSFIIPELYDNIKLFGTNLFEVQKDGKWGLVDFTNKEVLPPKYDSFTKITEDIYEFSDGSKKGHITKYGYVTIPAEYDSLSVLTPGSYLVSKNLKWGVLDNSGKIIVPIQYDNITNSSQEEYFSLISNNKAGLIDKYTLKVVLEPLYDSVSQDPVGFLIKSGDKIGFLTKSGKLVDPKFSRIIFEQPELGLAVAKEGNKLCFITSDGYVSSSVYDNISRFSNAGIAFVEKDGKLQAVNMKGKEMTLQDLTKATQSPSKPKGTQTPP